MSNALQKNLIQRLEEQGLSAVELERRTGLKHSAIQNIIYGRSKRPGIDIVSAIAKELGCAIEDLLASKPSTTTNQTMQQPTAKDLPWNSKLFVEATELVNSLIGTDSNSHLTDEILFCIKEIYNYAIFANQNNIDQKFAQWIVDRHLINK